MDSLVLRNSYIYRMKGREQLRKKMTASEKCE